MSSPTKNKKSEDHSGEATQKELDDLLRRMLSTPPKPHVKQEKKKTGK